MQLDLGNPVSCGIHGCVQVDSAGMELTCRTSSRCQRPVDMGQSVENQIGSCRATQWRSVIHGWESLLGFWASSLLLFLMLRLRPRAAPGTGHQQNKFARAVLKKQPAWSVRNVSRHLSAIPFPKAVFPPRLRVSGYPGDSGPFRR